MRLTKEEMVRDIFFLATNGKRNRDNAVDGMHLVYMIAENNYRWAIKDWYDEVDANTDNAAVIFKKMVDSTIRNTMGVNYNHTDRSLGVIRAYNQF